jgi:hypothetical protein
MQHFAAWRSTRHKDAGDGLRLRSAFLNFLLKLTSPHFSFYHPRQGEGQNWRLNARSAGAADKEVRIPPNLASTRQR